MKNQIINYAAFIILSLLWLGFGIALIFNHSVLDAVWQAFLSWPIVGKLVIGLLTLPVVIGMWIWQTSWPEWLRLLLVIGLAWVNLYTFFPRRKLPSQTNLSQANS